MVEYDRNYFRAPQESMYDYLQRLSQIRQGGILGTTQGMLANPEITDEPLAEVTQACPVGYAWDGEKCVPVNPQGSGSGDGETPTPPPATLQQMIDQKTGRSLDPTHLLAALGPLGSLIGMGAQGLRDNELEKALIDSGMTPEGAKIAMQDPEYVAQQIYSGRVGDKAQVTGGYSVEDKGKWNPVGGIVDSLFGVGGMFGAKAVPKNSDYNFGAGMGYEYVPAPVLPTASAAASMGLGQGLLSGMGAEGNRQYYITSDGQVRDVSALQDATIRGLMETAGGPDKGTTSFGYDPTLSEDYGGGGSSWDWSGSDSDFNASVGVNAAGDGNDWDSF